MTSDTIIIVFLLSLLGVALVLGYIAGIGWGARFLLRTQSNSCPDDVAYATVFGVFWPVLLVFVALRALARLILATNVLRLLHVVFIQPAVWAWRLGFVPPDAVVDGLSDDLPDNLPPARTVRRSPRP